jgi:hypothetical protein
LKSEKIPSVRLLNRTREFRREDLFVPVGTEFELPRDRERIVQMIVHAGTPWERAQAYWALNSYLMTKYRRRSDRALEKAVGELFWNVLSVSGEWWVGGYEPSYDVHGKPIKGSGTPNPLFKISMNPSHARTLRRSRWRRFTHRFRRLPQNRAHL